MAGHQHTRDQCTATSKSTGQRCRRRVPLGAVVCDTHGGATPVVRDAVRRRLDELAMPALLRLAALVESADSDGVRLAAARDLLDRAGYKPADKQEHSGGIGIELIHRRPEDLT